MREFRVFTLILLPITLLMVGSINLFSGVHSRIHQEPTLNEEEKAALAVVQQYVNISSTGKFDELTALTTTKPKRYRREAVDPKELAKKYPPGTILVAPNEKVWEESDLRRLRKDFPQGIRDTGHGIVIVAGVSVKDGLAKVAVNFGNEVQYQALPMVFVLAREAPEEKWKIFDITTPAYAADYK